MQPLLERFWRECRKLIWFITVLHAALTLRADTIPVRFIEGVSHGFLVLRQPDGKRIASGELLQRNKGRNVESRMIFRFKDGSFYDETIQFSQQRVFALEDYRLVQRGPSFDDDREVSMHRSGEYVVKRKDHKNGRETVVQGTIDLPPDVSNGLMSVIARNMGKAGPKIVHYVVFTPKARVVEVELIPGPEERVPIGGVAEGAINYTFKPRLGVMLGIFAKLTGKSPPDYHEWITSGELPSFLRVDGPLYTGGPVWRLEMVAPQWP